MLDIVIGLIAAVIVFGHFSAVIMFKNRGESEPTFGCQGHADANHPHQCQCGRNSDAASPPRLGE